MASFDLRSGYTPTANFTASVSLEEVIDDGFLVTTDSVSIDSALVVLEQLRVRSKTKEQVAWGMVEQLLLSPEVASFLSIEKSAASYLNTIDITDTALGATVIEPLLITSPGVDGIPIKIQHMMEQLVLTDPVIPNGNVSLAVASVLALTDLLLRNLGGDVTEDLILTSPFDILLKKYSAYISQLYFNDTLTPLIRLYFEADEDLTLIDTLLSSGSTLTSEVVDALLFTGLLVLPDGTAWVVNTTTKGLSEYTNFDFNSMTEINGKFYGANSDGIYELTGDTDSGTDIQSIIRTGLSEFGTSRKKRISDVYIGYTSTKNLVLKVIYNQDNAKREAWYELTERSDAHDTARFKVGKGAKARYWGFELLNTGGTDFHLDEIELFVLPLTRRL